MNARVVSIVPRTTRYSSHYYDETGRAHWSIMHDFSDVGASCRPCFHPSLMDELRTHQLEVIDREASNSRLNTPSFFVLASRAGVFNLGGDLELFARHIRQASRASLLNYARLCVEGVHTYHQGFGPHVHSIALVQGSAFGGGFEAALACNTIIAEEQATFALPEVIFGLFPGMGAYSFLRRRVGGQIAERLIMSGEVYTAMQLFDMGVIDRVVSQGQGHWAVEQFMQSCRRAPKARLAMNAMRRTYEPVLIEELYKVTEAWVDAALSLDERSLKIMERFARTQSRKHMPESQILPVKQIC